MYSKRKTYTKPYRKTTAPKSYRNGFVKTSKTLTAYLQGNKLIMNVSWEHPDGQNWNCSFKVTKNSQVLGNAKGIYMPSTKVLQITWKGKKYLLSSLK